MNDSRGNSIYFGEQLEGTSTTKRSLIPEGNVSKCFVMQCIQETMKNISIENVNNPVLEQGILKCQYRNLKIKFDYFVKLVKPEVEVMCQGPIKRFVFAIHRKSNRSLYGLYLY
jgi:hypothetical protein